MRVLGVDPGLTRCGLGVVDGGPGIAFRLVGTGVIGTSSTADIGQRLLEIERGVDRWLAEYQPDAVAVERVFSQHNVRTVMGTAQAGAVAIVCAARAGLPVALHTPSEVKAAVTGSGRADKAQVTHMVSRLLRLADPPRPADAADALALAICHLWRGGAQRAMAQASARWTGAVPGLPGTAKPPGTAGLADRVRREPTGVGQVAGPEPPTGPPPSAPEATAGPKATEGEG